MVDHHGSQCGFCTPGIVMSLYALWMRAPRAGIAEVEKALQGNLCRCTGYAPIIRAAEAVGARDPSGDPLVAERARMTSALTALRDGARVSLGQGPDVILPADADDLAAILAARPDATVVAGATDVGLWVTKHFRPITPAVFIGHLAELRRIEETAAGVTFGAGVSYTDAFPVIARRHPQLRELWDRIGGDQVRNMGTIGGNIANGSPIGDTPPAFIALDATLRLRGPEGTRAMPLEAFFIEYGRQDRRPGEFVESVHVPDLPPGAVSVVYKISKRLDEDITAVCVAIRMTRGADGHVTDIRIACGGMAGTPKRAAGVEAAILGRVWSEETARAAMDALAGDFIPLTDMRASAEYRMRVARNLILRFWMETSGTGGPVRLDRPLTVTA
jgi:xanthine dehydrogenase small subunit